MFDIFAIIAITRFWINSKIKPQKRTALNNRKEEDTEIAFAICKRALKEHKDRLNKVRWLSEISHRYEKSEHAVLPKDVLQSNHNYYAVDGILQYAFFSLSVREEEVNDSMRKSKIIKDIVASSQNIIEIKHTPEIQKWCEDNIPNRWKHIKNTDIFVFNDTNTATLFRLFWN